MCYTPLPRDCDDKDECQCKWEKVPGRLTGRRGSVGSAKLRQI